MIRTLRQPAGSWPHPNADAERSAVPGWPGWPTLGAEVLVVWRLAAWRRRWFGLGIACLLCLIGWTGTLMLPNRYQSSALLFADPGRGVVLGSDGLAWTATAFAALDRALLAPAALERVADAASLPAPGRPAAAAGRPVELAQRIGLTTAGPALFRVSYWAEHPDDARRTLEALVELATAGQPRSVEATGSPAPAPRSEPGSSAGPGSEAGGGSPLEASRELVAALRNDLGAALALRDARARQLADTPPVLAVGRRNPIYDDAAVRLGQQQKLVTDLRGQLAEAEAAIADLGPRLEAAAGDYAVPGDLGSRQAMPAARVAASARMFRVVGPPTRPTAPESALRPLLLAGVLIAGSVVGAVAALWRAQQDRIVDALIQLERRFQLPVLGAIEAPNPAGQRRRLRQARISFGLACLGLLLAFGSLAGAEALDLLAPVTGRQPGLGAG